MSGKITQERLEAIRQRAERATDGAWTYVPTVGYDEYFIAGENGHESVADVVYTKEDAEFIAHARQDIPDLLAEVERLKDSVEIEKIAKRDIVEEIFGDKIRESAEILAEEIRKKFGNGGDIDD